LLLPTFYKLDFLQNPLNMVATQLTQEFELAAEESKNLSTRPSNETLLQLYSLYKQATVGDIDTDPPANPFDFVAKAKYDAWALLKGKPKEIVMQEYINLVNKLKS
jgi:diazepam-binding inhibitor (GABA receptor modulating acyl-CoA-binding protein)